MLKERLPDVIFILAIVSTIVQFYAARDRFSKKQWIRIVILALILTPLLVWACFFLIMLKNRF